MLHIHRYQLDPTPVTDIQPVKSLDHLSFNRNTEQSNPCSFLRSTSNDPIEMFSEKGTWVRLLRVPVEGKVVQGFDGLDVGDRVRVQLISVDVQQGFIDFRKMGSSRH